MSKEGSLQKELCKDWYISFQQRHLLQGCSDGTVKLCCLILTNRAALSHQKNIKYKSLLGFCFVLDSFTPCDRNPNQYSVFFKPYRCVFNM